MTCCVPEREPSGDGQSLGVGAAAIDRRPAHDRPEQLPVPNGTFVLGERSDLLNPGDGEEPVEAHAEAFLLDATAVTNGEFATFVEATGFVTTAEHEGTSFVFGGLLPDDFPETRGMVGAEWWREVGGATWRAPEGPGSDIADRADHPVVHVSLIDASAYADWRGVRLPGEAEWERAARAGTDTVWWWGDELEPGGDHAMNVWQGPFPTGNTSADGFAGTAPVTSFEPNPWGLWNMVGNVWEWTVDDFGLRFSGAERTGQRVLKGGSYLCHASYCNRYRPAGRIGATPTTTTGHLGFRCASDPEPAPN